DATVTGVQTCALPILCHQTQTPAKITAKGKTNWLVVRTQFIWARVMVIRRSSFSFGRMEIRSSSDESQFMAFKARSRLPLKRMRSEERRVGKEGGGRR